MKMSKVLDAFGSEVNDMIKVDTASIPNICRMLLLEAFYDDMMEAEKQKASAEAEKRSSGTGD